MSDELREYVEKHALGKTKYGRTEVSSPVGKEPIFVRVFDEAPPECVKERSPDIKYYPMGTPGIWADIGRLSVHQLADWYGLYTYDAAVPQPWFDDQLTKNGEAPRAVWAYEWDDRCGGRAKSLFGEPVFIRDMIWYLVAQAFGIVRPELEARRQFRAGVKGLE